MFSLLLSASSLNAVKFLAERQEKIGLLLGGLDQENISEIEAADLRSSAEPIKVLALDPVLDAGGVAQKELDQRLWFVLDPRGEAEALGKMRRAYPNLWFEGVAEALLPALIAKTHVPSLKEEDLRRCKNLTVVFAAPRTGSSFVADVVGKLTGTRTKEHLRKDGIDCLSTPYEFDRAAALRRLLAYICNSEGVATTKVISHFAQEFIWHVGKLREFAEGIEGIRCQTIVIVRRDVVAQAVSGFLAMKRKLWHLESGADHARLKALPKTDYDFDHILALYVGYIQQNQWIDQCKALFPENLSLSYEADIAAASKEELANKISSHICPDANLPGDVELRSRLANSENALMAERFRTDYEQLFGVAP